MRKKLIKRSERPVCPETGGHFKAKWGDNLNAERLAIFAEMPSLAASQDLFINVMLNDNCKNPNTQLPNQVAAVTEFRKLIEAYFDMIGLSDVNQFLTEMLSAAIGPDPRSGKHKPITIANALYDVNNIISLLTKTKLLANEETFQRYAINLGFHLKAVGQFDVEHLSELLYVGLNAYIFQEDDFEGATLKFSAEITAAYKMIYDWLSDCDAWCNAVECDEYNETAGLAATP